MQALGVSLIALIARPADHDGRKVMVIGACALAFEAKGLYVSDFDRRAGITKNAAWLEVPIDEAARALSGQVVLVEGTFDATSLGHLGMYSGTLKDVTRLQRWG